MTWRTMRKRWAVAAAAMVVVDGGDAWVAAVAMHDKQLRIESWCIAQPVGLWWALGAWC
jgi:hypothetical protein